MYRLSYLKTTISDVKSIIVLKLLINTKLSVSPKDPLPFLNRPKWILLEYISKKY